MKFLKTQCQLWSTFYEKISSESSKIIVKFSILKNVADKMIHDFRLIIGAIIQPL